MNLGLASSVADLELDGVENPSGSVKFSYLAAIIPFSVSISCVTFNTIIMPYTPYLLLGSSLVSSVIGELYIRSGLVQRKYIILNRTYAGFGIALCALIISGYINEIALRQGEVED